MKRNENGKNKSSFEGVEFFKDGGVLLVFCFFFLYLFTFSNILLHYKCYTTY